VRYLEPGRLVGSNAELIDRVAGLARSAGRELATPEATRDVLGLPSTDRR